MEYGNFGNPNFEKPDNESDESDATKKKKKKRGPEVAAAHEDTQSEQKKEELAKQGESIWKKLIGERPEPSETTTDKSETPAEHGDDAELTDAESAEAADADVEMLSESEERYALEAYIQAREQALQTNEVAEEADEDFAVRQANLAFLTSLRSRLESVDEDDTIETPIEQAYDDTAETFDLSESADETEPDNPPLPVRTSSSSAGGATPPPRRPVAGTAASAASPLPFSATPQLGRPNIQPQTTQPEVVYDRNRTGSALLVGGVVGYLLGRRRGRIKTEKRMGEVQRKLEQRVGQVQALVVQKETKIQQLVREKVAAKPTARPEAATSQPLAAARPERPHAPAAERRAERLAGAARSPERTPKVAELNTKELLDMGEKIVVGATNLRQVFEAKLISESGLKRLVHEHMQGADIRRGLAREFMVKEMSFERDPRLRDSVVGIDTAKQASGGAAAVTSEATAAQSTLTPQSHASKPAAVPEPPKAVSTHSQTVSSGLLIALTLLTIGLAVYAVLLSINR